MPKFKEGDIIQEIRPFKGDTEKIVKALNLKERKYECVAIKDGKVLWNSKISFDNDPHLTLVG